MKRLLIFLTPLLLTLSSCEHRPLVEPLDTHYMRVYLDEEIRNVTFGFYDDTKTKPSYKRPVLMKVCLADPETDKVVYESYLRTAGEDSRGRYLEGYVRAAPGQYNLMVYNYGSETSVIRNGDTYFGAEAYTRRVADSQVPQDEEVGNIVYEPDHLFLATREGITIHPTEEVDTLRTASGEHFRASSVVQSYYVQVRVKGIQYVSSAASLMTGLGGEMTLHDRSLDTSRSVHVYYDLLRAPSGEEDVAIVYATFNTFGKLPGEDTHYYVTFDFIRTDGNRQTEVMDITPMFDTPEVRDNRWILIDRTITVAPPPTSGGGGMQPGVGEWGDIDQDIEI